MGKTISKQKKPPHPTRYRARTAILLRHVVHPHPGPDSLSPLLTANHTPAPAHNYRVVPGLFHYNEHNLQ